MEEGKGVEVCVLMCVYNEEAVVSEAVRNILGEQTVKNLELLVIDDGSTDKTGEILREIQKTDSRLRVVTKKHEGLCSALNFGLERTSAPYIARADADDISAPTRLEAQLRFLRTHPEITCVGTAVKIERLQPKPSLQVENSNSNHSATQTRMIEYPTAPLTVQWSMFFYCAMAHPSVMFNRKLLQRVSKPVYSVSIPGVEEKENPEIRGFEHCEDYALWHRLALEGHQLANLPSPPLMTLRKRPNSISTVNAKVQHLSSKNIIKHYLQNILSKSAHNQTNSNQKKDEKASTAMEIPSDIALGFLRPSELKNPHSVALCFDITKKLEDALIGDLETEDAKKVREDCTKRLGELALIGMKISPNEEVIRGIWTQWIRRDPRALLGSLLGVS